MSIRQAAMEADISESRWRQIEHGIRMFRGIAYPETDAPAATVARMAFVVGAVPGDLAGAGREDAAGELEALLASVKMTGSFSGRQKRRLAERLKRRQAEDEQESE